jgi:hypothetical protein
MSKLSNTQLTILSSASRRNDRGVDLPANVTDEPVRKAVDKLIRAGLLKEVRANGSLLAWRRDAEARLMALRITKHGLEAVGVKDNAAGAPAETPIGAVAVATAETSAADTTASRKRTSVAAQKPAGTKHQRGKAKTKAGSSRESRPGSKQARVLAMLGRPEERR